MLAGASLLVYLLPMLAIACIGLLLSTVTRNSAAAVVGTLMISLLMQLLGIIPGARRSCTRTCSAPSSTPGRACCATPIDWAPIVRAAWVCALYALPSLVAGVRSSSCAATSPAARWLGPCRRVRTCRSSTAACS